MPPLPNGAGAEAVVETPNGPVPFAETVEANKQKALAVPDELARQAETHDQTMSNMQQASNAPSDKAPPPKGKKGKGVGKFAGAPFREGLSALEACLDGEGDRRPRSQHRQV